MRVLKIGAGFTLIALGVVMVATPGPGWLTIAGGLALLASEYAWARRWRDRLRDHGASLTHRIGRG